MPQRRRALSRRPGHIVHHVSDQLRPCGSPRAGRSRGCGAPRKGHVHGPHHQARGRPERARQGPQGGTLPLPAVHGARPRGRRYLQGELDCVLLAPPGDLGQAGTAAAPGRPSPPGRPHDGAVRAGQCSSVKCCKAETHWEARSGVAPSEAAVAPSSSAASASGPVPRTKQRRRARAAFARAIASHAGRAPRLSTSHDAGPEVTFCASSTEEGVASRSIQPARRALPGPCAARRARVVAIQRLSA
mmetsp:Transcript_21476/g.62175  ORF Transcript_21476/g.62175 Transcript_21476/m.62175 type:complete len:245 (-) Transcript_21476:312-1046(-)